MLICQDKVKSQLSHIPIEDTEIYKELRQYRLFKSHEEEIKAYYIFNNAQLEQIISMMPNNTGMLTNIKGFTKEQSERYGADTIRIIQKYL
jgi:superfamily II DNA helicase RecQ